MAKSFPGIPPEGLQFLSDLAANNDREWFAPRKTIFETKVKAPLLELIGELNAVLAKAAPDYVTDPAKSLYRIYRDTRFSKDKTPYKTHASALFWKQSLGKDTGAAMYLQIGPDGILVGGGIYMSEPDTLRAIREYAAENAVALRKILARPAIKSLFGEMSGESATRVPKGFDPAHPEVELLKRKQFLLFSTLDASIATTPKLYTELKSRFEAIAPFIEYLNVPVSGMKRIAEKRFFED